MDILRNKLRVFLGVLKNDLKKIAVNKKEIDEVMKKFIENVEKTFNEVKKHRHPHHHRGFRFLNNDLVDSNMCSTLLAKDFPLKDKVNIPVVKKREEESFCKAKADYIKLAKNNNKQIMGLINTIFDKNRDFIHTVLNIRAIESIIDLKS